MVKLNSIELIVISMMLLMLPGMLYNNANNTGLVVNPGTIANCDNNLDICNITNNVGCQAAASNCALSGQTISFLNNASPFTALLNGNLLGLFGQINGGNTAGAQTSLSGVHGAFDQLAGTSGTGFIQANCNGQTPISGSRSITQWLIGHCTQTYTDTKNTTEADASTWTNWNTKYAGASGTLQFFNLGNGTYPMTCSWQFTVNYTATANGPGWNYFGCDVAKTARTITNQIWSFWVAIPSNQGQMASGFSHIFVVAQTENWDTAGCTSSVGASGQFSTPQCTNFAATFKGFNIPGTSVAFVPSVGPIGALLFGLILFIAGLGLSVGVGGGVSIGINEQGARLAQVLGIALIVWSFLYSEFSTWFTSGLLPYGLDGSTGVVGIVITGSFFFGVLWRTVSYD